MIGIQTALVFFDECKHSSDHGVMDSIIHGCLNLCIRHLDSSTRRVSRMSEECLGVLVRESDVSIEMSYEK